MLMKDRTAVAHVLTYALGSTKILNAKFSMVWWYVPESQPAFTGYV